MRCGKSSGWSESCAKRTSCSKRPDPSVSIEPDMPGTAIQDQHALRIQELEENVKDAEKCSGDLQTENLSLHKCLTQAEAQVQHLNSERKEVAEQEKNEIKRRS